MRSITTTTGDRDFLFARGHATLLVSDHGSDVGRSEEVHTICTRDRVTCAYVAEGTAQLQRAWAVCLGARWVIEGRAIKAAEREHFAAILGHASAVELAESLHEWPFRGWLVTLAGARAMAEEEATA